MYMSVSKYYALIINIKNFLIHSSSQVIEYLEPRGKRETSFFFSREEGGYKFYSLRFKMNVTLEKKICFKINVIFNFQWNINHTFPSVPLYTLFPKYYFYFAFMIVVKKSIVDMNNLRYKQFKSLLFSSTHDMVPGSITINDILI